MPPSDRHLQQSLPSVMLHAPRPPEKRLGPWELLAELGRGSNGMVFRARRPDWPVDVALKVLPEALRSDPEAVQRFRQEAELGRRLDHPGLVRTLDVGDAGSHLWYAMELVPGETLAARLRRGKLPVAEATALVLTLARAMAHAHAHRVVHRDLKPANVILSPTGPRITDLGLARDQDRVRALTRTGDLLGTPLYMAPEQLQGVRGVDARVDVWALGVLLFECVTGDRPFHASDPVALARVILHQDAPPLRSVAPHASPALEAVVRMALARSLDDRYPDAGALAAALESLAPPPPSDEGSRPSGSGSLEGAPAPRGVGVPVAVGACVVAVLAAGGAVVLAWPDRTPVPERAVATERAPEPARAPRSADLDAALEGLLAAAKGEPRAAEDARARALAAAGDERQAVDDAGRRAAAAALDAVAGLASEGAPLEALLARLDVARALAPDDGPTRRRADRLRARHLHRRARYAEAAAAARALEVDPLDDAAAEGLSILARLGDHDPAPADAYADGSGGAAGDPGPGAADPSVGRPGPGVPFPGAASASALARLASSGPEPWRTWAIGQEALDGARTLEELQAAERAARAALERDPDFAPAHELLGRALHQLARVRRTSGALDAADAALRRAREAAPDDVHVELWRSLVRFDRQDYEGKVELLSRAIALSEPAPQRRALFWRAHTLHTLRRYGEARRDLERLVQLRPDDVEAALWRALLWSLTNEQPRALAEWRRLVHVHPAEVDALLGGQSSVETQPIAEGLLRALVDGARRAATPMAVPRRALADRLDELAARSGALAPWADVEEALALAEAEVADQDRDGRDLVLLERARACFRRGRLAEVRAAAARLSSPGGARRVALEARFLEAISWTWGGDVPRGLELLRALHTDDEGPVGCAAGTTWNSYQRRHLVALLLGRAATAVEPGATEAAIGLASTLGDVRQSEGGLELVEDVLRRVPDHPRALAARATLLTTLGRPDDALASLDAIVKLSEPAPFLRILVQRGQLRFALAAQRLDGAGDDAERAVAAAPTDIDALGLRALVREARGRRAEAAADLRAAREADPVRARRWFESLDPRLQERLRDLLP